MVSTYLSYDLVTRDLKSSLARVAQTGQAARDMQYYKDNIGKITTLDEFLDDDRLYNYAMTANGLEDMIYAKGFMRKVLESDLTDENSYASRLTDVRYRNFAASFNFSKQSDPVAQSTHQIDDMVGLYTTPIKDEDAAVMEETRYYNIVIDKVKSVDQLLNNDRMRAYLFQTFSIDESNYSRAEMRALLSSDVNDPDSYVNTKWGTKVDDYQARLDDANAQLTAPLAAYNAAIATRDSYQKKIDDEEPGLNEAAARAIIAEQKAIILELQPIVGKLQTQATSYKNSIEAIKTYFDIAAAFDFNADGTVAAGSAQTDEMTKKMNESYIFKNPRVTPSAALLNKEYFESKVATATNVTELLADPRVDSFIRTAYGLTGSTVVKQTLINILTSDRDPNNKSSYVSQFSKGNPNYRALLDDFNFNTDGSLSPGVSAQTKEHTRLTSGRYMSAYNDKDDEKDEKAITAYKRGIANVTSVAEFMADSNVYNFALQSVGLDPAEVSRLTIKNVFKSDPDDPKSYVNKLKDERYLKLLQAFNFNEKGEMEAPLSAQSEATVTDTAKSYIIQKTRFVDKDSKESVRADADKAAEYYEEAVAKLKSVKDLLADRKIVDFVLEAKGIDPKTITDDVMKKLFASDLEDPESFANTQNDARLAEIVASFNFDVKGNLSRERLGTVQQGGEVLQTANMYMHQLLETEQGEDNAGVRLALYFQRMAGTITSAYDILGDTALLEAFKTLYSLPDSIINMDIEQQAKLVEKYLTLEDLKDPEKVSKLVKRFTILYDLNNGSSGGSAVDILMGGGGNISADTLMALSQIRPG